MYTRGLPTSGHTYVPINCYVQYLLTFYHFTRRMTFTSVVCGCSMNPEMAPALMQPMVKSLNDTTVAQLSKAISSSMLVPGWKVKGGWKTLLQTILRRIVKIICIFLQLPDVNLFAGSELSFEDRLFVYFKGQGYDELLSKQMAKDIANVV